MKVGSEPGDEAMMEDGADRAGVGGGKACDPAFPNDVSLVPKWWFSPGKRVLSRCYHLLLGKQSSDLLAEHRFLPIPWLKPQNLLQSWSRGHNGWSKASSESQLR
jgi:hypothetical protein